MCDPFSTVSRQCEISLNGQPRDADPAITSLSAYALTMALMANPVSQMT